MKKLFPDKKESKKKLLEFLDKKGFYIVLVLCLTIIAVTTFYVARHSINSPKVGFDSQNIIPDDQESANDTNSINSEEKQAVQSSVNSAQATAKPEATIKPQGQNSTSPAPQKDNKAPEKTPVPKAKPTTAKSAGTIKSQPLVMPVFGDISKSFAKDKLVYSQTLEEWRSHEGLDIAVEKGTVVKAAADGFISAVVNDPKLGITVTIDHQNGLKTVYANLAGDDMVSVNQKVKQGDVIGCIGNSASFEAAEQSHLHFEVWKNNVSVDPSTYLTKKQ